MFICEYCKKEFTIKGNLISHQKSAKYCLEIQGKNVENNSNFNCDYCNKTFTLKHILNDHISICKEKQKKEAEDNKTKEYENEIKEIKEGYDNEIKEIKEEYENEIKKIKEGYENEIKKIKEGYENEKTLKINNLNNQINFIKEEHRKDVEKYDIKVELLNQVISKLESKLESYERRLFEMASSKTNNTNSNNKTFVINNTNLPLTNEVLRKCATTFTIDNARSIEGMAKHFTSSLEDHITCTDQSRGIFKYNNEKYEEIIDTDMENLIPQYLIALKDENNFLYKEVVEYFKENNVSVNEQTDYNILYNALNSIIEKKGHYYSEKVKKYIVKQCKKQFLEKNKNKEKEITKELTDEEIMMNVIRSGGTLNNFLQRLFDMEDLDNETDEQFEYRRKMEDLFKQKKKEWKESEECKEKI